MKFVQSNNPHYNPGNLLDVLHRVLEVKNDSGLARALEVGPPVISKIRRKTLPIAPGILIRLHEMTSLSIRDLRRLAGDFREHTGASATHPTALELAKLKAVPPAQLRNVPLEAQRHLG